MNNLPLMDCLDLDLGYVYMPESLYKSIILDVCNGDSDLSEDLFSSLEERRKNSEV